MKFKFRHILFLTSLLTLVSTANCFAGGLNKDSHEWRSVIYVYREPKTGMSILKVNEFILQSVGKPRKFKFHRLWKYTPSDQKWIRVEPQDEEPILIKPIKHQIYTSHTDRTLLELPTTINLFYLEWFEDQKKVSGNAFSGPIMCNDVSIGEAPKGMIVTCVPFKDHATAMFIPDPKIHCQD